jgi:hypothetical protein
MELQITPSNSDPGFFNTQGQWFQTLGTKINKVSNKIHQLTLEEVLISSFALQQLLLSWNQFLDSQLLMVLMLMTMSMLSVSKKWVT